MVRSRPRPPVAVAHRRQIQAVNDLDDKAGQVPLRKPLVHRRRQKVSSLAINRTEIAQLPATQSRRKAESMQRFYPTLLSALSPTGCYGICAFCVCGKTCRDPRLEPIACVQAYAAPT